MTTWFTGEQQLGTGQYNRGRRFRDRFQRELDFMEQWSFCVKPTDTVYMMGNMVQTPRGRFDITWYHWLSSLPGHKILMLGARDNVLFNQGGSFTKWYESFGFEVKPFNQCLKFKYHHENTYNILLSCLPASGYLKNKTDLKYLKLHKKFRTIFNSKYHNYVLNIHSHSRGTTLPHKTFDVSMYPNLLSDEQIVTKYLYMV